jgi:hypothetical protein
MKTVIRLASLVAVLALAGFMLSGCEDTDVTVPSSGVINMNAQPGAIQIDPNTDPPNPADHPRPGRFEKTAIITATVFDDLNLAQKGVTVDFESTSGIPMDPPTGTTDSSGRVQSTLHVTDLDEGTVSVTARSGVVTGVVSLDVSVVGGNQLPRAVVSIIPGQTGQVNNIITYDGSGSLDPDGNITCFQWELDSDNPDNPANNPEIVQGPAASGINRTYLNEQTIAVTLRVSDDPDPNACDDVDPSSPGGVIEPVSFFSPLAALTQYPIECNNPPPTAIIAGATTVNITATSSQPGAVVFDGSLSYDRETAIERYVWSCGGSFSPVPVIPGDNSKVTCRYTPGTYTATLYVTDQGSLPITIDPNTGTFVCQKTSQEATVNVIATSP